MLEVLLDQREVLPQEYLYLVDWQEKQVRLGLLVLQLLVLKGILVLRGLTQLIHWVLMVSLVLQVERVKEV